MTFSLTGECADEIFGGYPWFFREDALRSGTFPWSLAIDERQQLLNPDISKKVNLKDIDGLNLIDVDISSMIINENKINSKIFFICFTSFFINLIYINFFYS